MFLQHVLDAFSYIAGRQYGVAFFVAAAAMGLIYLAVYFLTRGAR